MEILKLVVVCLILMTKCFAVDNKTADLEPQLKIQKREKQYLIEDDPSEGPEQKRDERQSTSAKMTKIESKIKTKPINLRLQPKKLPALVLKSTVLPKPINLHIDTTPQRIPTKIPVVLKTAKVIPTPAHALRSKMLESGSKGLIPICATDLNPKKENKLFQKDNIPFTIEDKVNTKSEDRTGPNIEDEVILNQESKVTVNKDTEAPSSKDKNNVPNKNEELSINKYGAVSLPMDKKATLDKNKEDDVISSSVVTVQTKENSETLSDAMQKPIHFFIDEDDPLPPVNKKQPKSENRAAKTKEGLSNTIKEVPIVKKVNSTPKKDESKQKEHAINDYIGNDPDTVHISNGTHLISIKKMNYHDMHKIQHLLGRNGFDEPQQLDVERIINRPPKLEQRPSSEPEENVMAGDTKNKAVHNTEGTHPDTNVNKEKDPNDCITITNRDYEEFQERTTIPPSVKIQPTNTCDGGIQDSWNYLQNLRNLYNNPNHQNMYDQYRRQYDVAQTDPNIQSLESNDPYAQTPEYPQTYYPNENQPNYNDPYYYEKQPEIDSTYCPEPCPEPCPESTLDRIWRAWKDVEIKIRKSQTPDDPIGIDIRRNILDSNFNVNNGDVFGKAPIPYASQPISLNGYYNNQNNGLIYPYVNPTYRYTR